MSITEKLLFFNKSGYPYNFTFSNNVWNGNILFDPNGSDTFKSLSMYILEQVEPKTLTDKLSIVNSELYNETGMTITPFTTKNVSITNILPVNKSDIYYTKWIYGTNINKLFPVSTIISFNGIIGTSDVISPIGQDDFTSTELYTVISVKRNAIMIVTNTVNSEFNLIDAKFNNLTIDSHRVISFPEFKKDLHSEFFPGYDMKLSIVGTTKNDGVYEIESSGYTHASIYDYDLSGLVVGDSIELDIELLTDRPLLYSGSVNVYKEGDNTLINFINNRTTSINIGTTFLFEDNNGNHLYEGNEFTVQSYIDEIKLGSGNIIVINYTETDDDGKNYFRTKLQYNPNIINFSEQDSVYFKRNIVDNNFKSILSISPVLSGETNGIGLYDALLDNYGTSGNVNGLYKLNSEYEANKNNIIYESDLSQYTGDLIYKNKFEIITKNLSGLDQIYIRYNPNDFTLEAGSKIYITDNIHNDNLRKNVLSIKSIIPTVSEAVLDNSLTSDNSDYTVFKVLKSYEKNIVVVTTTIDGVFGTESETRCLATSNIIKYTHSFINTINETIDTFIQKYKFLLKLNGIDFYRIGNKVVLEGVFSGQQYYFKPYLIVNSININSSFTYSNSYDTSVYNIILKDNDLVYERTNMSVTTNYPFYADITLDLSDDAQNYGFSIVIDDIDYYVPFNNTLDNLNQTASTIGSFFTKWETVFNHMGLILTQNEDYWNDYYLDNYVYGSSNHFFILGQEPNVDVNTIKIRVNPNSSYTLNTKQNSFSMITSNYITSSNINFHMEDTYQTYATTIHPRWNDSHNSAVYGTDKFNLNLIPSSYRNGATPDTGGNQPGEFPQGATGVLGGGLYMWTSDGYRIGIYAGYSGLYASNPSPLRDSWGMTVRIIRNATSIEQSYTDGTILPNIYTDADGNKYTGTKINNQVWIRENLKTTKYVNSLVKNGIRYGRLYNYYAANDPRGIGPIGWHVPSAAEWNTLISLYSGVSLISTQSGGTNTSGFNMPLSGYCSYLGVSSFTGSMSILNTSTFVSGIGADSQVKEASLNKVRSSVGNGGINNLLSIRLIKDNSINEGDVIIEGEVYNTVTIGTQVWLTQNLAVTHYRNGDLIGSNISNGEGAVVSYKNDESYVYNYVSGGSPLIPLNLSNNDWVNNTSGAMSTWEIPKDEITTEQQMLNTYGGLYNFYALNNSFGLVDKTNGWRIPSMDDVNQLYEYLINSYPDEINDNNLADFLKSTRQVNSPYKTVNGTIKVYEPGVNFIDYGFSTGMIISLSGSSYPNNNKEYNIIGLTKDKIELSYQGPMNSEISLFTLISREYLRRPRETNLKNIYYNFRWEDDLSNEIFMYELSGENLIPWKDQPDYAYTGPKPLPLNGDVLFLNTEPNSDKTLIHVPYKQQTIFDELKFKLEKFDDDNASILPRPINFFFGYNAKVDGVNSRRLIMERTDNVSYTGTSDGVDLYFAIENSSIVINTIESINLLDIGFQVGRTVRFRLDAINNYTTTIFEDYKDYVIVDVTAKKITVDSILTTFSTKGLEFDFVFDQLPEQMAQFTFYGETETEDERLKSHMSMLGIHLTEEDEFIFSESDIKEEGVDYKLLNYKRKEMMNVYTDIYNYVGSYTALFNAVYFFGYTDLELYEYYRNVDINSPLFNSLKRVVVQDLLNKDVEGWSYSEEMSKVVGYKKTNLINLTYRITDEEGNNVNLYSLAEVQIKLNGLKNWLRQWVIPINSNIRDLTGVSQDSNTMWRQFDPSNDIIKHKTNIKTDTINFNYIASKNFNDSWLVSVRFYNVNDFVPEYFDLKVITYAKDETGKLNPQSYYSIYKTNMEPFNFYMNWTDGISDKYMFIEVTYYNNTGAGRKVNKMYALEDGETYWYDEFKNYILVNNNFEYKYPLYTQDKDYIYINDDEGNIYIITKQRFLDRKLALSVK